MRKSVTLLTRVAALATLLLGTAGCPSFFGNAVAPATAGSSAVIGVDNYDDATGGCNNIAPGPSNAASAANGILANDGWNPTTNIDNSANASTFSSDLGRNAVFFIGHGAPGIIAFAHFCDSAPPPANSYWGVGDEAGTLQGNTPVPSSVNAKWLFLLSSDTVAPEAGMDAGDSRSYQAMPWEPLFYNEAVGLRGIYGYWQAPYSAVAPNDPCLTGTEDGGTRVCDVTSDTNQGVITNLLNSLWVGIQAQGSISTAWQQANNMYPNDGEWSEMFDSSAQGDQFNAASFGALSQVLVFESPYVTANVGASPLDVPPQTGTLAPARDINETLNVSGAVASGDNQLNAGTYTTSDNGSERVYTTSGHHLRPQHH